MYTFRVCDNVIGRRVSIKGHIVDVTNGSCDPVTNLCYIYQNYIFILAHTSKDFDIYRYVLVVRINSANQH